jgi:hypothetical protein
VSDPTGRNDLIRLLNGEDAASLRARRALADRLADDDHAAAGPPPTDAVLAAYLDGTLPEPERAAVDRYLAVSAEGRAHLEALADLLQNGQAGDEVAEETLAEIVALAPPARVKERPVQPGWRRTAGWIAGAAAALGAARLIAGGAIAVTAGVMALWHPSDAPRTGNTDVATVDRRNEPNFLSAPEPTSPPKCDRNFTITNRTAQPVREVHLRSLSTANWGTDLLTDRGLAAGQVIALTAAERGIYDLRVVLADGAARERAHIDICEVQRVIITPDGLQVE